MFGHATMLLQALNVHTEGIRDLSRLFPLSSVLGLMPCAEDDQLNRRLLIYVVFTHAAYRISNVASLAYLLMRTRTSISLMALLASGTVMKFLCPTVHVVTVVRNRQQFLKLVKKLHKSEFLSNKYRIFAAAAMAFCVYLYTVAEILAQRWDAAVRDVFSMMDVLVPILIILQFCTFLKIATDRFKISRMHLLVHFHKTDTVIDGVVERHLQDLEMVAVLRDLYSYQVLFCVCFLGFDFFVAAYDTLEHLVSAKNLTQLICTISYCTLCLSTIMVLASACEETQKKAEKFDLELFHILMENQALRRNPKLDLYLKRKIPVHFTGGHFFNVGYSLVTSIVAATATYLTFLIQFKDDDDD